MSIKKKHHNFNQMIVSPAARRGNLRENIGCFVEICKFFPPDNHDHIPMKWFDKTNNMTEVERFKELKTIMMLSGF